MWAEGVQDLGKEGIEFEDSVRVYVGVQEVRGGGKMPSVAVVGEGGAVKE